MLLTIYFDQYSHVQFKSSINSLSTDNRAVHCTVYGIQPYNYSGHMVYGVVLMVSILKY